MAVPLPMGEPGLHVVTEVGLRLVVIEGAGNVVNRVRPDAFNEALLDFPAARVAGIG